MKQYRVWTETSEAQLMWLTDAQVVEYRRRGYSVREA